ncbi:MAG: S1 RNA-binding domain-containing protein [Anaerolineae bacterium]|jgi:small subunit ribosomal protein S1
MAETTANERLPLRELEPKMKFEGEVTNVELYGAFVDIGAERDGLVHISQIRKEHVNRVADVLNKGDKVTVWVQSVDPEQGRISLTMVEPPDRTLTELKADQVITGRVTRLVPYGAFVDVGVERDGLVHISEMAEGHIDRPEDVAHVGDEVEVKVLSVNRQRRRIELSMVGVSEADESVVDDEGEEPPMTAMELAWHQAMEREGVPLDGVASNKKGRQAKSDTRRQQAAIIARTLREQEEREE